MKVSGSGKTQSLLLKIILKVILTTFISIILYTFISARIVYGLDLDIKAEAVFSIIVAVLCAATTAFFAVLGIKNNGLILGLFAQVPLLFYSLLNVVFFDNTLLLFAIKSFLIICTGMLVGLLTSKRSRTRLKY